MSNKRPIFFWTKTSACSLVIYLLTCSLTFAGSMLERFDHPDIQGQISGGAIVALEGGLEKGALQVSGTNNASQTIYSVDFAVAPAQAYSFSFNFRTSNQFPGSNLHVRVEFYNADGEKVTAGNPLWRLTRTNNIWRRRQFEVVAPESARRASIYLCLVRIPQEERVWIDNFCLEPFPDGLPHKVNLSSFETTFDDWRLDRQPLFDHFMISSGRIIQDWQNAKVGEAYFEAYGNSAKMQYPLYIDNIRVKPNHDYIFQAWMQADENFSFDGNGMIIFFFRDIDGNNCKPHAAPYLKIRPSRDWKAISHSIRTPENCAFVDIGLNLRNQPASSTVRLDHLRFFQGEDKITTQFEIDPDRKSMSITNIPGGALINAVVVRQVYKIISTAGGASREIVIPGDAENRIDLTSFADGTYTLSVTVEYKNGQVVKGQTLPFGVYNSPDWANDFGIQKPQDPAPAPWRNLQFAENAITTWNNRFFFSDTLQLKNIDDLFASPLQFSINQENIFRGQSAQWIQHPSQASASSLVQGEGWEGALTVSVDYLGFTQYSLKITAKEDTVLTSSTFTATLKAVDFINRNDGSWSNNGALDLNQQSVWESRRLCNAMQYGTLDRGLTFYVERIYPSLEEHAVVCTRAGKDGRLSVNLINAPLKLSRGETRTLGFAFLPYPYRPAEKNFRRLRFRASPKYCNFGLLWQTSPLMKYCGSLMQPESLPETLEFLQQSPELTLIYQGPTYIMECIPQWSYFAKKWCAVPHRAYPDMAGKGPFTKGDYRQRSWRDLYIKNMVDTLKIIPWGGVYYDVFGISDFLDNGELYKPIGVLRAFHERVYNAQRLQNPKSFTLSHSNGLSTLAAYSNSILTGEQHRSQFLRHKYFQEFMSLDVFRYENAVNIGADWMLLPQYRHKENIEDPTLSAHVMGMATLHNMMIYPNFIRQDIDWGIRDRQYDLGMHDAEFYGYWQDNPEGMSTNDSEVKVSYWKTPRGCFITVFNNSDRMREFIFKTNYAYRFAEYYEPVSRQAAAFEKSAPLQLAPWCPGYITLNP